MITVLAGGTGSVKLVRGLAAVVPAGDISVISNVGDNIWLCGLYVCPDIDTVTYGLAGILDQKRGWGIRGDTFSFLAQLKMIGMPSWFGLGDRDLATHVLRTEIMREGRSLTEATQQIARRLGVAAKILPATDEQVATMIATGRGEMHLQEFWVKNRGRPQVAGVRYAGAESARASSSATEAIRRADRIIIAPANPVSSIGPIVALAGIRQELAQARDRVVAVSPVVGRRAVSGPAAKYMKAAGLGVSAVGIAEYYSDFAGSLVIAKSDRHMAGEIRKLGLDVRETNIMMHGRRDEARLARYLLEGLDR